MNDEVRIEIDGDGVRPDTVQLADVIAILTNFYAAVLETAKDAGLSKNQIQISLTAIESGSDTLVLRSNPKTHDAARQIAKAIETRDESLIPKRARTGLIEIWNRTLKNKWTVKIAPTNAPAATITHARPVFRIRTSHGSTSLLCYIIRVGGEAPPTVKVLVPSGEVLTADVVNRTLAEELGKNLYKTLELRGRATWSMRDWTLQKFVVQEIGDYCKEASDPARALKKLSDLSDGSWDSVDPDKFIEDLRHE